MGIGGRLKAARRAAGLSLRALADEVGVSAQAISKYERDMDVPGSAVLLKLARALDVKVEYFFRTRQVTLQSPAYRCRVLARKQEQVAQGQIQDWLERYVEIESLLPAEDKLHFTLGDEIVREAKNIEDAERAAQSLRDHWGLGVAPIESMVELLEDRGIKVGMIEADERFDGCTFELDGDPVIAIRRGVPGDRQRFSLAHELGHIVLRPVGDVSGEKAASRFAGAFLVPASVARRELGAKRRSVSMQELFLLKHKYGLSMQAWIYRAKDLHIISEIEAAYMYRAFRRLGNHNMEPGEPIPQERPTRMEQLVFRALAEDIISQSRAAELLDRPLSEFWSREIAAT